MNKQELIEKVEPLLNRCYERIKILDLIEQLDEPQYITSKNVISRMKQLFPTSREEWIDKILKEFGEEFGSLKFKAGYEQGKLEGEWVGQQLKDADKVRQELNKPTVPQYVADWYEKKKHDLNHFIWDYLYNWDYQEESEFKRWMDRSIVSFQTLVNMHQFGYTVEKEKRYRVKVKGMNRINGYLAYNKTNGAWYFGISGNSKYHSTNHTRKELEEANFGWVFDCEGIEIEEVG